MTNQEEAQLKFTNEKAARSFNAKVSTFSTLYFYLIFHLKSDLGLRDGLVGKNGLRGREDGWKVSHVGQSGHGDGLQWCVGHRHSLRWRLQTEMFSRVERQCESEIFAGWSSLTSLAAAVPDQRLEVNGPAPAPAPPERGFGCKLNK